MKGRAIPNYKWLAYAKGHFQKSEGQTKFDGVITFAFIPHVNSLMIHTPTRAWGDQHILLKTPFFTSTNIPKYTTPDILAFLSDIWDGSQVYSWKISSSYVDINFSGCFCFSYESFNASCCSVYHIYIYNNDVKLRIIYWL